MSFSTLTFEMTHKLSRGETTSSSTWWLFKEEAFGKAKDCGDGVSMCKMEEPGGLLSPVLEARGRNSRTLEQRGRRGAAAPGEGAGRAGGLERRGRWRWRALLRRCYAEVLPLGGLVRRLQGGARGRPEPLVQDWDPPCYRRLVSRCAVGLPAGCQAPPEQLSFQQFSSPRDVVERIIQRICEKSKKNVLAFGYALLDETKRPLPGMPALCRYLPNSTTETICQSVLWETVLSRVGDEVMMYLLEHCALFVLVPPSCCYQICGQPIYELTSGTSVPSPLFLRQRYSRPTHNILSGYLQGRRWSRQHYLGKAKWRKHTSGRPRWGPQEGLDGDTLHSPGAAQNATKSNPVTMTSNCLASQPRPSQQSSFSTMLLKRKRKDCSEMNAKRMKITPGNEGLEEQTRDPYPTECKNQLGGDGDSNAAGGSTRPCLADQLIPTKYIPQKPDYGARDYGAPFVVLSGKTVTQGSKTETLAKSSTEAKVGAGVRRASPMQKVTVKNHNTEKCLTKHTSNSVGVPSDKIRPAGEIKMRDLLYSCQPRKERLRKWFVLNRLKRNRAGGQLLVEAVFLSSQAPKQPPDPRPPSSNRRKKRLPKRYWQMGGLFQELLQNHARCPYPAVLKRNCPVWALDQIGVRKPGESLAWTRRASSEDCLRGASGGFSPSPQTSGVSSRIRENIESCQESEEPVPGCVSRADVLALLKQSSSHWQVYTFVRECLERVVPAALWGSNRNKCRFYKNVKKFISLGKLATFSLRELMWKMRVNDCAWLRLTKGSGRSIPATEHRFREDLLSRFLYWLMDSYVAELLRSFFYITETMFQKNLLFFYRKAIWSKLQTVGVRSHLGKVRLRALLKEEIESLQKKKCVPLAAKLRFIPKTNGLRPVVKLSSVVGAENFCKKSRDKKVQYFNTQLKNLFSVLKYEHMKNPSLLGSSVFGKDDIYAVWKKFVLKILESSPQMPAFYFVKADVTGAYDTIPHNKLVGVILQILAPDNKTSYCIRRYAVIIRTRNGQIRKYYRRHVSTGKDFIPDMELFVHHLQESTSLRNAVIVEQSITLKERRSNLREVFLQLIHNSILKIENRYYVQCCGIPQGSILSTLFCNLCYGDMENKLLCGVQEDGVLMRLTDDFLLVTPHLAKAKAFLRALATGVPEYGFTINPAKTIVNFPLDEDMPGYAEFKQLPAHSTIPWCGLLIDTQTLEVYCDYSSYAGTSIRASLAFNCSSNAGVSMRNKLLAVLQLKCHHLFLDLQINSLRTVCINVYKIFLLQAYRFHACVLQLPFNQQIKNNPCFFLRVIADTASCCFSILKAKNAGIPFSTTGPSAPLTCEATQWLCYHAFSVKLGSHTVIYKCLLMPLRQCKIRLLQKIPEATMQLLQKVTDPSLCEDFKAILD